MAKHKCSALYDTTLTYIEVEARMDLWEIWSSIVLVVFGCFHQCIHTHTPTVYVYVLRGWKSNGIACKMTQSNTSQQQSSRHPNHGPCYSSIFSQKPNTGAHLHCNGVRASLSRGWFKITPKKSKTRGHCKLMFCFWWFGWTDPLMLQYLHKVLTAHCKALALKTDAF